MPPELLNILVSLPVVAAFIWYSDRLIKQFLETTKQFLAFLTEERATREALFREERAAREALAIKTAQELKETEAKIAADLVMTKQLFAEHHAVMVQAINDMKVYTAASKAVKEATQPRKE